jgi:N-sulfoglucosamine sulfohydrolase
MQPPDFSSRTFSLLVRPTTLHAPKHNFQLLLSMVAVWLVAFAASFSQDQVPSSAPTPATQPPHLVVFLADDYSFLDSEQEGAKDMSTPNLTKLAAAGMTFSHAFVASPSCAPSRAALLTGLTPAHNGAQVNHSKPAAGIKKLPAYLKEIGYEVVSFGKVSHYKHTADYGFDHFEHDTFHDPEGIPSAIQWLKQRKSDKPLCIFVGSNWPHVPWPAPPANADLSKAELPPSQADTPETRRARFAYAAAVKRMDDELGQVMTTVKETLGTQVAFMMTSDHGAQFPFGKWNCYDAGIRVPMVVSWPGVIAPGSRVDAMVSWVDILPTLVDLGGGKPPPVHNSGKWEIEAGIDGRSFAPVLRGETKVARDRIFTTHSADGKMNNYPMRSIRTQDWKLIQNLTPEANYTTHIDLAPKGNGTGYWGGFWETWEKAAETDPAIAAKVNRYHHRPAVELYDLVNDPFELNNLAADPAQAERVKTLRAELDDWRRDQRELMRP